MPQEKNAYITVHAREHIPMPNPTRDELDDSRFKVIYRAIKGWDIAVPESYGGYCAATGSHAVVILRALNDPSSKTPSR